jgi:hypothetical protein
VGLLLALGLPLSGKLIGSTRGEVRVPTAGGSARAASGAIRPVALVPTRSGFAQVSPDAARFAVVIRNPNPRLSARATEIVITFHDRNGKLVGSTAERLDSVPAGGVVAVAGQAGVAGPVASVRTRVAVAGYGSPAEAVPFVVRGISMTRKGAAVVVRASVGARRAVRSARAVVVYVDRAGRILGGDFTYIDVPSLPRLASAVVSTYAVSRSAHHAEVYVLDPR